MSCQLGGDAPPHFDTQPHISMKWENIRANSWEEKPLYVTIPLTSLVVASVTYQWPYLGNLNNLKYSETQKNALLIENKTNKTFRNCLFLQYHRNKLLKISNHNLRNECYYLPKFLFSASHYTIPDINLISADVNCLLNSCFLIWFNRDFRGMAFEVDA